MPKLTLNDFSGGLRTDVHQSLINDNESPAHRNVWTFKTGTLKKRPGHKLLKADITALGGGQTINNFRIFSTKQPGTAYTSMDFRTYVVTQGSSSTQKLCYSASGDDDYSSGFTVVDLGGVNSYGIGIIVYDGSIYILTNNASTPCLKFNGTTVANAGNLTRAFHGTVYKEYTITSDAAEPYMLKWSATANPESWTVGLNGSNFTYINKDDGYPITGLINYKDSIFVFKGPRNFTGPVADGKQATNYQGSSIWKFTGDPSKLASAGFLPEQIDSSYYIGSVFPDSVTGWNNNLYFCTNDGLYLFNGTVIEKVSDKIQKNVDEWNKYQTYVPLRAGNTGARAFALINFATCVYKNMLFMTVAENNDDTQMITSVSNANHQINNAIYVFEEDNIIWRWTNTLGISALSLDWKDKLIAMGNSEGNYDNLYSLDSSDFVDNVSTAIDSSWTSKEFDFKRGVHFKFATIDFKSQPSGILNFEYSVDQKPFVQRQVDMSGTGSIKRSQRLLIGDVGRTIQFRLSNNQAYVNFEVFEIGCEYVPLAEEAEVNTANSINYTANS